MPGSKPVRALLLYAADSVYASLSYFWGMPEQFRRHPRFACTAVNLRDHRTLSRLHRELALRAARYDAIVLLHSVFSNACELTGRFLDLVARASAPKAFFIGNEYKLMPEKMDFAGRLGIGLLVTQNPDPRAQALYRTRLGCAVASIPHAGWDPELFRSTAPRRERPIDLGYRAFDAPLYIGHTERRDIADLFLRPAIRDGLALDISLDPKDRFDRTGWAAFLNRCKGQLGTEAGGDYFEIDDRSRLAVNAWLQAHPGAAPRDVLDRFFAGYRDPVPVRIISGRHVEAAGTRTVQVLYRGRYNDYFQADEHYIPLERDGSNVGEALAKFRDEGFCARLADNAFDVARSELTYARLIDRFHDALRPLL